MTTLTREQELMVDKFAGKMREELLSNANKGDFMAWQPSLYELVAETGYHMAKLNKAMLESGRDGSIEARKEVDEYAADIANYMAKISMMLGTMTVEAPAEA